MLLFDAHLDLSMNALEWNRDLTRPLEEVRRREKGKTDKVDRGVGVCTLPEMRKGEIGICIATQIGRYVAEGNPLPGWHSPEIVIQFVAEKLPPSVVAVWDHDLALILQAPVYAVVLMSLAFLVFFDRRD